MRLGTGREWLSWSDWLLRTVGFTWPVRLITDPEFRTALRMHGPWFAGWRSGMEFTSRLQPEMPNRRKFTKGQSP